ncbi:uncharacterized mitochondrial protein AtMg00860-like [Aristolochia californica]|uniref:uncharacterized mitochondrial protein AtMg00860-like n=1 Tax=Aristolochia californica TaxID=171875 RepID=UPI0035DE7E56
MSVGLSNAPSTFQALMNGPVWNSTFRAFKSGISIVMVMVDAEKIQAISNWSQPMNTSALGGFLGFARYYKKFIKNYGLLATPLTSLLKKNSFIWNDLATQSFTNLKLALVSTPVLYLPNFEDLFEVECDASGRGIGAFLL